MPLRSTRIVAGRVHAWLASRAASASANSLIRIVVWTHSFTTAQVFHFTTELGVTEIGVSFVC